ncbi:MAG: SLBB domain-containing protein [Candidatus Latescibacterota bacterium]|jgi:protein involved in polysaccharide export with SLBB domain
MVFSNQERDHRPLGPSRRFPTLAVGLIALVLASAPATGQRSLEELVEESVQQETQFEQQLPEGMVPEEQPIIGRVRLPQGAEVEKLRLSQDRRIDPDTYLVGPGDVLELYVWGEFDRSYLLQVDPEGNVLIPTVGVYHLVDQPLSRCKELIDAAARAKYPGVPITITLASMRFFTVYLSGAVLREGSQVVQPTTRVSDVIERAGGYLDELRGATIEEEIAGKTVQRLRQIQNRPAGRRSIRLQRGDGRVELVDLDMFHASGRVDLNPYLRMGDVVHVGYRQDEVFIYGAINREGVQEYRPGDTVVDLVTLANGLRSDAPMERAEVWRFREGTDSLEVLVLGDSEDPTKPLVLDEVLRFPLRPKDTVYLRSRTNWQRSSRVVVSGEVQYQGRYQIYPGITRLRDLIDEAGGLTELASLSGARVVRSKLRKVLDPELERLRKLQEVTGLADMNPEDRAYLKTKGRQEAGRAAVDFERLFLHGDESQNVVLEDGDVVFIPPVRRTVTISGQVRKPGLVDFEEGKTVGYYMEKAGGYAYSANKSGSRLIRSRTGEREMLRKGQVLEPGDEIWIPEKEYRDWWAFTQGTMRTVAETLTLIILIRSF